MRTNSFEIHGIVLGIILLVLIGLVAVIHSLPSIPTLETAMEAMIESNPECLDKLEVVERQVIMPSFASPGAVEATHTLLVCPDSGIEMRIRAEQ